jgi:glycosyltransferase involved in cell wall biosynthesis
MPEVELPIFGFVLDVDPAMSSEHRLNVARWVTDGRGIFGISEFTRQELLRAVPSQANKIHAIQLAAPGFRNWNPKPLAARKYDFYYPARAGAFKNHLVLFQACVTLAQLEWRFRLALSGAGIDGFRVDRGFNIGYQSQETHEARRFLHNHASLLGNRVEVIGEVAPPVVDRLYEDTRSVVLPSAYEGFGFPLAEALHRGIPVICADIPAFREQLRLFGRPDNVQIVPANDALCLAAAMEHFLKRAPDTQANRKAEVDIQRWTWQDAARRCFELLSAETAGAS